jgi:hypothetical protein
MSTLQDKHLLDLVTTKPTKWCGVTPNYHYSDVYKTEGGNVQSMELFYNFKYFARNAQGWGQMNSRDFSNLCECYTIWRELVGDIAKRARDKQNNVSLVAELIPKRIISATLKGGKEATVKLVNWKDFVVHTELKQKRTEKEFAGIRLRLTVGFKNNEGDDAIISELKEALGSKAPAARPLNSLGDFVQLIIDENEDLRKKPVHKDAPAWRKIALRSLTMGKWRKICGTLKGTHVNMDDSNSGCMHHGSIFNPKNAFAPLLDTVSVWNAEAVKECVDPDNYEMFQYPFNNRHVYRINIDTFLPEDQVNRFFPHIPHPDHVINYEREEYLKPFAQKHFPPEIKVGLRAYREATIGNLGQVRLLSMNNRWEKDSEQEGIYDSKEIAFDDIPGAHLLPNQDEAIRTYDHLVMQKQRDNIPDNTVQEFGKKTRELFQAQVDSKHKKTILNPEWQGAMQYLIQRHGPDRAQHKSAKLRFPKWIVNPEYVQARHRFIISRYMDFEKEIWHEDACIPDSVKSICLWEKQFRAEHRNFSMPQEKMSSNLSPFGDLMASRLSLLETAEEVFTVHTHTMTCILSSLQVFFDTMFHAHVMFAGPARSGKSFTQIKAIANLIPGTFRKLTYETMKAKTGAGSESPYKYSHLAEFFEEILPTTIGISNNTSSKNSTNNTDAEALFKNLLTSGEITFSTLMTDANGKRHLVEQTIKVNSVIIAATNAYFSQIPDAMISRFVTITYQNNERADRGGAVAKVSSKPGIVNDEAKALSRLRWKRDQYLIAKTAYFIQAMAGIVTLDFSCADAVFAIVADAASKEPYCLRGFSDVRKIEQLRFIATPLVCLDAFHKVFDSETSNIKDLDYHPIHFLQILPYLKSTTEHAVFALGNLEHQFEDRIYENVVDALIKNVFKLTPNTLPQPQQQYNSNSHNNNTLSDPFMNDLENDEDDRAHMFPDIQSYVNDGPGPQLMPWRNGYVNDDGPYYCVSFNDIGLAHKQQKTDKHGRVIATDTGSMQANPVKLVIEKLANILGNKMMPSPQTGDIIHAVCELKEKTVSKEIKEYEASDRVGQRAREIIVKRNLPILEFDMENSRLKILKSYVLESFSVDSANKNKLRSCIEKTLSHKYARECELVYGAPHEYYPNIFQTVKIKPNPNAKTLNIINPDYFDDSIKRYSIAALKGVMANNTNVNKDIETNWDEMFASKKSLLIECDLDDYFTYQFLSRNYYTEHECKMDYDLRIPFNHPLVVKKQILNNRSLLKYPDCYKPYFNQKQKRQQQQNNEPELKEAEEEKESTIDIVKQFKKRMKAPAGSAAVVAPDEDFGLHPPALEQAQQQEYISDTDSIHSSLRRVQLIARNPDPDVFEEGAGIDAEEEIINSMFRGYD